MQVPPRSVPLGAGADLLGPVGRLLDPTVPTVQLVTLTFSAWGPFWPWVMSNSTFCPSSRLR